MTDFTPQIFDSPDRIDLTLDLGSSVRVELTASDRSDTVVTVAPRTPGKSGDEAAASAVTVDFSDGKLRITAPRRWKILGANMDSWVLTVELPTGSNVSGELAYGDVRGRGRFGALAIKTSYGELEFDDTADATLRTSAGDITVDTITGTAELTTSMGAVRVELLDGSGKAKSSTGDVVIGEVTGELEASTATGNVTIDTAGSATFAKTAYGKVRIGSASHGTVRVEGSYGELEIGIPEGTVAWLDVSSQHGVVRNELNPAGAPGTATETPPAASDLTVEVRARVNWGDVVIRRPITRKGRR